MLMLSRVLKSSGFMIKHIEAGSIQNIVNTNNSITRTVGRAGNSQACPVPVTYLRSERPLLAAPPCESSSFAVDTRVLLSGVGPVSSWSRSPRAPSADGPLPHETLSAVVPAPLAPSASPRPQRWRHRLLPVIPPASQAGSCYAEQPLRFGVADICCASVRSRSAASASACPAAAAAVRRVGPAPPLRSCRSQLQLPGPPGAAAVSAGAPAAPGRSAARRPAAAAGEAGAQLSAAAAAADFRLPAVKPSRRQKIRV